MKRMLAAAAVAAFMSCGDPADSFRQGVPTAEDVKIKVPESSGQALSSSQDGLEGARADFYVVTRGVTLVLNGATVAVLGLVKGITDHRPTSMKGNEAVWGPHTDPLSPNTYKFTTTKVTGQQYEYVLEAKGKSEADDAYKVILKGAHEIAPGSAGEAGKNYGNGSFTIYWNEMQKLPEHGEEVGTAAFVYSRLSETADTTVSVELTQFKDKETGKLVDASYRYLATPAQGGSFDFKLVKNLDSDPARSAIETATIRSRWLQTGAGRADVKAVGGDLGTGNATASECWDENFASRFLTASFLPEANKYGAESSCAFATAEYSSLTP